MHAFITSLRLALVTLLICVAGYTAVVLGLAKIVAPDTSEGSLIVSPDGKIVGSRLLAQKFTQPGYFWPRPSAVDYNASAAGGSNKSPTNSALAERAQGIVTQYGATPENPLPPELAAASGAGLDPHLTMHAALYQAGRVAQARGLPQEQIESLVKQHAFAPGGFLARDQLVNVLELNLALDQVAK